MSQEREIELKFEVDLASVEGLMSLDLLRNHPVVVAYTETVYFDTPKGKLRKAGVTLRVRRSGDTFLQTVKADSGATAGLFDRAEWNMPVQSLEPDLAVIGGTAAEPLLAKDGTRGSLRPVFRVDVERWLWNVALDGAEIELVLDRGEIAVHDRREPVLEIELELKSGGEPALFALVERLSRSVLLRIGVLTKSERGNRLVQRKPQVVVKAEPVIVHETMSAGEAFETVAYACIRHFRLNEPQLLTARNGEALHQARVALRRLRSAFSIFRPLTAGGESDALRAELSWISGVLGKARDLDVFIEKRLGGANEVLVSEIHDAKGRAYDEVLEALNSPRVRGTMIDLIAWIATGNWRETPAADEPATAFAASALDRFWRKVKKGGRELGSIGDEQRHEVRIAGKKLRYAAEFFAGLYKSKKAKRRSAFLKPLEALQSDLGDLNDMATAVELSELLSLELGTPAEQLDAGRSAQNNSALLVSAEASHRQLEKAGPFWR